MYETWYGQHQNLVLLLHISGFITYIITGNLLLSSWHDMLHSHMYILSLFSFQYCQELVAILLLFAKLCNTVLFFFVVP